MSSIQPLRRGPIYSPLALPTVSLLSSILLSFASCSPSPDQVYCLSALAVSSTPPSTNCGAPNSTRTALPHLDFQRLPLTSQSPACSDCRLTTSAAYCPARTQWVELREGSGRKIFPTAHYPLSSDSSKATASPAHRRLA
ncbi:hypothetical protein QBC47DRAFT_133543 [Echria macrotheca]|uniref:Uncharacterized protein n=1 Tax=Echria macrotheca TaxID=438768 RepID=A0AAJ0BH26_9PEZI|nr:hypothetical protein QBC47DRAFT_133543 [Echria macrotheca]